MTIVKNKPLYPFNQGMYCRTHHIIVEGSNEEIGYNLAKLAQKEYNCNTLNPYAHPIYGVAQQEYFATHWPAMNEQSKGVLCVFGFAEDDNIHDALYLSYDLYNLLLVMKTYMSMSVCS